MTDDELYLRIAIDTINYYKTSAFEMKMAIWGNEELLNEMDSRYGFDKVQGRGEDEVFDQVKKDVVDYLENLIKMKKE